MALLMSEQFERLQGKASDAAALHPVTNGLPATLAAVTAREQFGFGCRRCHAYREDRGGVGASTSVLSLWSSFVASVHEVLDLFERERAVLIGVHRFKDALMRRLKFLQ